MNQQPYTCTQKYALKQSCWITFWKSARDRLWLAWAMLFIASTSGPVYFKASLPLMIACTSSALQPFTQVTEWHLCYWKSIFTHTSLNTSCKNRRNNTNTDKVLHCLQSFISQTISSQLIHTARLTGSAWSCTEACTWEQWGLLDCLWSHSLQTPHRSRSMQSWSHAHQQHAKPLFHRQMKCSAHKQHINNLTHSNLPCVNAYDSTCVVSVCACTLCVCVCK